MRKKEQKNKALERKEKNYSENSSLEKNLKILLVYPEYPETFWSFRYALQFVSKRAAYPPLGLLTVASLLPPSWPKRLVDLNVRPLKDSDIAWADYVFISAMVVQKKSRSWILIITSYIYFTPKLPKYQIIIKAFPKP